MMCNLKRDCTGKTLLPQVKDQHCNIYRVSSGHKACYLPTRTLDEATSMQNNIVIEKGRGFTFYTAL
jgi:hypothetical protein